MLFVTPVSEQKGAVALPGHFTLLVLLPQTTFDLPGAKAPIMLQFYL